MLFIFSLEPFYSKYVWLPGANSHVLPQICYNPKFWPFCEDAFGALDGSHFHCAPPQSLWAFCQNCKGFLSQNCLFACSFDFLFMYAMTGWEGSANDVHVWEDAHLKNLVIPDSKCYLADAGYPSRKELLPYHNVHYHLVEWGCAGVRYEFIYFI